MVEPTPLPTPLQPHASVRLLLPLVDHPRAQMPVTIAWHVLEAFIKQRKLLTSRDGGPGQDNGDLLCTGFITRGAELPAGSPDPWTWLDADLAWQSHALRPVHQPAPRSDLTNLSSPGRRGRGCSSPRWSLALPGWVISPPCRAPGCCLRNPVLSCWAARCSPPASRSARAVSAPGAAAAG
ncbi:hypothetical protein [Synechococcus sp. GFB01]|uniref:hypothetical protein n=1 Tax=Synechococcus sp. GFB01 TaxID=1662190 RepID=UPI00064E3A7D|nr:hypothetical protein [Synechococcus sp. GFB01]